MGSDTIIVRALKTIQRKDTEVYSFFLPGSAVLKVSEISRIERTERGALKGFQRNDIQKHVTSIVSYLDSAPVLFPNAIILALSRKPVFKQSRGPEPEGLVNSIQAGLLHLPIAKNGQKTGWIVDGQQRALALSRAKNQKILVPVVAFVSNDIETHREQFILVNKAKPLSPRLVDELLPEVGTYLPRELAQRQIPSELVNMLNSEKDSPFYGLINRPSTPSEMESVITDRVLVTAIRRHIENPLGALVQFKNNGDKYTDIIPMYKVLVSYWRAVKAAFPNAWGKPPSKSRLMHSAGILSMSMLLDRLMARTTTDSNLDKYFSAAISEIAPACCWISGTWPDIQLQWNEIEYTSKDVKSLTDQLLRLDMRRYAVRAA